MPRMEGKRFAAAILIPRLPTSSFVIPPHPGPNASNFAIAVGIMERDPRGRNTLKLEQGC